MRKRECNSHVLKRLRPGVMTKTSGLCWYCGRPAVSLDHVQPLNAPRELRGQFKAIGIERYSRHDTANLVPACFECNNAKDSLTVPEWRDALAQRHGRPVYFWGELHLPPPGGVPLREVFDIPPGSRV